MENNPMKIADLMSGAQNCCIKWANVKKGEDVLIITDTNCDFRNAQAISSVCRQEGATVSTVVIPPQELPNQEPPKPVAEAMKAADIVFAPLYYTISHTTARFDACNDYNTRFVGMYASTDTQGLASKGAQFPAEIIFKVTQKVAAQWTGGKKIHITCDKGTDISGDINNPDKNVVGWHATAAPLGSYHEGADSWMNKFGNFAGGFGVVGVWPEWSAEGVMYYDAAHTFCGRLEKPLKFTVEKGRVVKMEGATPEILEFFQRLPERFGPDAHHLAEFMIGLNPWTRLNFDDPTHMEAHRHAGGLHTAIGMSVDRDRTVNPGIHLDQYIVEPNIFIDDVPCVEKGKLLVYYEDPEVMDLLKKYGITL